MTGFDLLQTVAKLVRGNKKERKYPALTQHTNCYQQPNEITPESNYTNI